MSTIPFQQIPGNLRVPFFFAEVNNQNANTATQEQRALLIGPMISTGANAGTATPGVPLISQGPADANAKCGAGSIISIMTQAYRNNDSFGELWYLPLADDPSAVAATGTIAFTAAATATGVIYLYIGGQRVTITVTPTMTTAQIATAVAAAINALNTLPVTATATTTTVTLTSKNKSIASNDIDIRMNYGGVRAGESTPAGLTYTITAMANGAVNASLTAPLANLSNMPFDFIACAYTDSTSMAALTAFLNFTTGRWSWQSMIYGHTFYAFRGTFGTISTFGATLNDPNASVMGFFDSPTTSWEWAAAYAAQAAVSVRANPGVPLQSVVLQGILPPPIQSQFTGVGEQNSLLFEGISTFTVDASNQVHLQGTITTYQTNAEGQPDNSYLQLNTMYLIMAVIRSLQTMVTSKYSRMILVANGTLFAPGAPIITPDDIRADLIANYGELEYAGLVQDSESFADGLIVQQNVGNPNRVDIGYDPTLVNQLNILALLFQFML
ncbi:MAG: phage tail sheath subtilisin-like domain-containing protein [Paraburkholderia sp.]|uniref:phage tail sheath subtilisin-like domain-containing protein n=1 Tax=Burkholderiaceae TaxID=119060 RepID=UPI001BB18C8D|nr:phage tail sheath subtilisin-like domain-containing protein [Burkholderia sp. 4M9327F10]